MERKTKYWALTLGCLLMALSFTNCSDDETTLTAPMNLTYEPTMGGAIIKFTPPSNSDLLYVKAAYTNSLGKDVFRTTSIYDNKIEIDGLADETKTYPIHISAVDKWGGETSSTPSSMCSLAARLSTSSRTTSPSIPSAVDSP